MFVEANIVTSTTMRKMKWALDTAATHHFCRNKEWFKNYREVQVQPAALAEGSTAILGIGDISFLVTIRVEQLTIHLRNVLHTPGMRRNLISGRLLHQKGYRFGSDDDGLVIRDPNDHNKIVLLAPLAEDGFFTVDGRIVLEGEQVPATGYEAYATVDRAPRLAYSTVTKTTTKRKTLNEADQHGQKSPIECTPRQPTVQQGAAQPSRLDVSDIQLWHERFGHINCPALRKVVKDGKVRGIPTLTGKDPTCEACHLGKATRAPHVRVTERSTQKSLDLVHSDVCMSPVVSHGGARYLISFIDDHTRKTYMYPMRTKDQAFAKFREFLATTERATGNKLKRLRTDNGMEYCAEYFQAELRKLGIKHERTNIYSPQMNGVAERFNRTLMDSVRTILIAAELSGEWWAEVASAGTYLKNRSPHSGVDGEIPDELFYGRKPSVGHLRKIGSLCFIYDESRPRSKLQPRSTLGVLVGYALHTRGYRVWCPDAGRAYVRESNSVRFDEKRIGTTALRNAQKDPFVNFYIGGLDTATEPYRNRNRTAKRSQPYVQQPEEFIYYGIEEDGFAPVPQPKKNKPPEPERPAATPAYETERQVEAPAYETERQVEAPAYETERQVEARPGPGWKREVVIRQTGQEKGRPDIYYRYQEGKRLRSINDVGKYCVAKQIPFSLQSFDFSTKNTTAVEGPALPCDEEAQAPNIARTENGVYQEPSTNATEAEDRILHPEAFCAEGRVPLSLLCGRESASLVSRSSHISRSIAMEACHGRRNGNTP
jgi:transposase InsO family protein